MTGQGSWNESTSSKSSEKSQFRPNDFMYIPNWQPKEFLGKFAWRLKPLFRIIMAYWPFDIYNSRYIFCKPFYNIARKFVFSNSIARAYFIFLLCTLMTSTNKSLEEKNFPSGWKCYKTIGSYVSCAFIKIWSTWEVWRALKKLEFLLAMPQATLTHLLCSVVKKWEAIYPLHPNINAYILHTFLFNSLWYQHGEFVFTIGRFLNWWLFPWF